MFFKNKKKVDSKVRFQNRGFRNRLVTQRNYKRTQKKLPQNDWGVFLNKIGLGSIVSQALTFIAFLLLIYIVYVPNYLYLKTVNVTGVDQATEEKVKKTVSLFFEKTSYWPQKNLILLSTPKLKDYVLTNNPSDIKDLKITKKFPNTLNIQAVQRVNKFLLTTKNQNNYLISEDGITTSEIYPDASGTLPSSYILIKLDKDADLNLNEQIFKSDELNFINRAVTELPSLINTKIIYIEINNFDDPYIQINTLAGYILKLDSSADFQKTLSRIGLLYTQILPGDLKNLKYIDFRFADRAFTCAKNNPCTDENPPPINTSTPISTVN